MDCCKHESVRSCSPSPPLKRQKTTDASDAVERSNDHLITVSIGPGGVLHVWNAEDAVAAQMLHHIVGAATGCFAKTPLQDIFKSLPLRLSPAEAAYLRDINAANFVNEMSLLQCPTSAEQLAFDELRDKQSMEQHMEFERERELLLDQKKQEILKGKMKKMHHPAIANSNGKSLPDDQDQLWKVVRAELLSRPAVRQGSARIELPFRSWRVDLGLSKLDTVPFLYPQTHAERVFYAAYSTLMKAGFWLTSGMKYGGDLLLYEGDVHVNHSIYIVKIVEEDDQIPLEEILRIGRVATAVHKVVLWATIRKDYTANFTCSKWSLMK